VIEFVAGCGILLILFAFLALVADALGEPERWDSRRRNGR